jgi:hypothetical protein
LLLPDAACSDRERPSNKTLVELSIERRKLLQTSQTSRPYNKRFREKNGHDGPEFSTETTSAVTET